jgi:hypothetical protein
VLRGSISLCFFQSLRRQLARTTVITGEALRLATEKPRFPSRPVYNGGMEEGSTNRRLPLLQNYFTTYTMKFTAAASLALTLVSGACATAVQKEPRATGGYVQNTSGAASFTYYSGCGSPVSFPD